MAKNSDGIFDKTSLEAVHSVTKSIKVSGEAFEQSLSNASKAFAEEQQRIAADQLAAGEELERTLGKLRAQGLIKNNKEAREYALAREADIQTVRIKNMRDLEKENLAAQLNALRAVSKEAKEQHDWEVKRISDEKNIVELQNKAEEAKKKAAAARKAENKAFWAAEAKRLDEEAKANKAKFAKEGKQKEMQDKVKSTADEMESYSKGDIFKEALNDYYALKDNDEAKKAQQDKINDENMMKTMKGVGKAITEGLNAINNAIKDYAKYQTGINSRLQGTSSYRQAESVLDDVAFSPLLKAEDLYSNLADLVGQGIATNVEQRAFFATTKEGIAQTFDVTDNSLKRIIRLQREDSTAARLGLEAYLNKFLNTYVENTEYLTTTFDNVAASLFEASAMLGAKAGAGASAEFEYVVQKWLGALVGLGFSESTAQNIATALGQLGSGDVTALAGSEMQNLLVMAANKVNKSYADMLMQGLNASDANELMKGVIDYLHDIGSYETNVVKNQLAGIFGVTVSDLVAAANLTSDSLTTVYNDLLSVNDMYNELEDQYDALPGRVGISNILDNLFSNLTYQTGMNIGANPALFAAWKITDMIQGVTGGLGIPIPAIKVMGTGFDLENTIENLIKMGITVGSMIGNIGKIIGGIASVGNGSSLLGKLDITSGIGEVKKFGKALGGERQSGQDLTEVNQVGNTDDEAYEESAANKAEDDAQKKVDAKKEKEDNVFAQYYEKIHFEELLTGIYNEVSTISMLALLAAQDPGSAKFTAASIDPFNPTALTPANLEFTVGQNLFGGQSAYKINLDPKQIEKLLTSEKFSGIQIISEDLLNPQAGGAGQQATGDEALAGAGSSGSAGAGGSSATASPDNKSSSSADAANQSNASTDVSGIEALIATHTESMISNFEKIIGIIENAGSIQQNTTIINNQYETISNDLSQIKSTTERLEETSISNAEILNELKTDATNEAATIGPATSSDNDLLAYFTEIEFATNFSNLVTDVGKIAAKYLSSSDTPNSGINPPSSNSQIGGFTQFEF